MQKADALTLISKVFESPFDLNNYQEFLTELLVKIDLTTGFKHLTGTYIFDKFRNNIASYMRIAKYPTKDKEIDLLVVKLKDGMNLDRNRGSLRNFVMHYLDGGRGKIRDAALVAFIEPNTNRWRLSLICLDKEIAQTHTGNITTHTKATSAYRYSFILGENEPSHTAQQQFLPFLEKNTTGSTLPQLESIFAVEKLSNEFFNNYVTLLTKTKDEIVKAAKKSDYYQVEKISTKDLTTYFLHADGKKIDVANFAKKLLGQIVFLYFLQKKGWLGVEPNKAWGSGNKVFMRHVFKQISHPDNYFNKFLEPLFYQALAIKQDNDYFALLNCKIPFLNGGLFEPYSGYDWINHKLELANTLFSNTESIPATKNSITLIGTGILDVFDRYNFTVCEDEPLDKAVAIDPEMLGKIFENTIADNERRGKGAFYTPRLIVHYMVKQSLIEYLARHLISCNSQNSNNSFEILYPDIEKLVNNAEFYIEHETRIANNGETKTYTHELPQSIIDNATLLDTLLENITILDPAVGSGAFPVGLLIELVKIRQVLQVYTKNSQTAYQLKYHAIANCIYGVDIDQGAIDVARLRLWLSLIVDKQEDVEKIQPLPNLDYKLIVGNSLTRIDSSNNMFIAEQTDLLHDLDKKFTTESNNKQKSVLKQQINELLTEIMHNGFDFRYVFGKYQDCNGFDIVIGNPPYVGEKGNSKLFKQLKQSKYYQGKMDLFYLFFHLAIDCTKDNGIISFITTNYFITADSGKKLRQDFTTRTAILEMINFNELKLFESALGQHNMITILLKSTKPNFNVKTTVVNNIKNTVNTQEITTILAKQNSNAQYLILSQQDIFDNEYYIRIPSSKDSLMQILKKVKSKGKQLHYLCNINQGIVSGADKISPKHINTFPNCDFIKNEGIFVLSNKEIQVHNFSNQCLKYIKDFYKNSDIKQYVTSTIPTEKILYIDKNYIPTPEKIQINNHLSQYKNILSARREFQNEIRPYYQLHRERNQKIFELPKIVAPQRSKQNTFGYNEVSWYASADVYFITDINTTNRDASKLKLKYILALLNSKLYYYWFYNFGKRKGESLELYATPLKEAPIYIASPNEQQQIVEIVDQILFAKQANSDTSLLEKQIDYLVYKLYNLTDTEITTIENN